MYNLLATSDELIEQKQQLIEEALANQPLSRLVNEALIVKLNTLDIIIKLALDTEEQFN